MWTDEYLHRQLRTLRQLIHLALGAGLDQAPGTLIAQAKDHLVRVLPREWLVASCAARCGALSQ